MSKTICEICNRKFKDHDGLEQHKAAKHDAISQKENKINKNTRNVKAWIIGIVAIGLIIWFVWWGISSLNQESQACKTDPVSEINIGGHENLALHIHSDLKIIIDGKQQNIPADIGVLLGILRPIHTHDALGKIHMEGNCPRDYKIKEFFEVWNRKFSKECIFDKCTSNGTLTFSVNGKENSEFEDYIMRDRDDIIITYESNR